MTEALDYRFGPFNGGVWLNCAHQGPLPHPARDAVLDAVAAKTAPATMTDEAFIDVPARLRGALAGLIGANEDDVLLANSTSYTLNVVAQGLSWRAGDEVVCVDGDFPATVLPWRTLEDKGVRVSLIGDGDARIDADTVAAAIGPRTRVVCLSWVFSFFGHAVDIASIARATRERDVWCVINASQAVGARPLNVTRLDIDALACCGFKWLCGPYATGFGWLRPELRAQLDYPQPHWLRAQSARGLNRVLDYTLSDNVTATAFDVFCNANFFNYAPLAAAVKMLGDIGIERIAAHDQQLIDELIESLDRSKYELLSPASGEQRSTLVYLSHQDPAANERIAEGLRQRRISIAQREGRLRVAPHLYNSSNDITRLTESLSELG
jgi:cysteine desulfurase / selenocysteine lyase